MKSMALLRWLVATAAAAALGNISLLVVVAVVVPGSSATSKHDAQRHRGSTRLTELEEDEDKEQRRRDEYIGGSSSSGSDFGDGGGDGNRRRRRRRASSSDALRRQQQDDEDEDEQEEDETAVSGHPPKRDFTPWCATPDVTQEEMIQSQAYEAAWRAEHPDLAQQLVNNSTMIATQQQQQQQQQLPVINVQTFVHVIHHTDDNGRVRGRVSRPRIREQVKVMNAAYAPANVKFRLKGITYTEEFNWSWVDCTTDRNRDIRFKRKLKRGGKRVLNIYVCFVYDPNSGDDVWGFSTFATTFSRPPNKLKRDGVVIHPNVFPGGPIEERNKGHVAVHEVGHWLGLHHPFWNGCEAPGDEVDDTPYEARASFACNRNRDTCKNQPGKDPVTNYMDYSPDSCTDHFTAGQYQRMREMWTIYRA